MVRNKQLNEQMRQQSRERILAAARKLFAEKGYFNCTVSDIVKAAEMSQGNLYWYFPGKEELLKAVLAEGFERVETVLVEANAYPAPTQEKVERLVDSYLAYLEEGGEFNAIFLSILGHGGGAFIQELGFDTVAIGMRYHQILWPLLEQARQEGLVDDCEPNYLGVFFFSLFNGFLLTYRDGLSLVPAEQFKQAVLRMLGATWVR